MKHYQYLLFDADETLFDFRRAEYEAFFTTVRSFGCEASETDYAFYSRENDQLWHRHNAGEITKAFLTVERWRIFAEYMQMSADPCALNEAYKTNLGACSYLIEGAAPLCRSLKEAGYRLYIITNGIASVQHHRFNASPLAPLFEKIFISEELGAVKPAPAYFSAVLAAIGEPDRDKMLIIGDSIDSDIKGGMLSGIDTLWYNPRRKPLPADITPTHIADSYSDIHRLLL